MSDAQLDAPVVLIIFNRPDHTRAVFEVVAAARPKQLFVIADGPRPDYPTDASRCATARLIATRVDWQCKLHTHFSEQNLGCARRISSGLDWVFAHVDRAIILEDDCVPDLSFFRFCAELLKAYENDNRIRTIAGSNFLYGMTRHSWSYHFSKFHLTWGWATWRRSWEGTDMAMRRWPEVRDSGWLVDILNDKKLARFWVPRYNKMHDGRIRSWAGPYQFSCWLDNALSITPNWNLVSNVGAGQDATHTRYNAKFLCQPTQAMPFPLAHPSFVVRDLVSDRATFNNRFLAERPQWLRRATRRVYHSLTGRDSLLPIRQGGRLLERALVSEP